MIHDDAPAPGSALAELAESLMCPVCSSELRYSEPRSSEPGSLRCTEGHTFDIARQGYASLLHGTAGTTTADTAAMVAAREEFLRAGHYSPIAEAVSAIVPADDSGLCIDLAGGTGYYLARFLDGHPAFRGVCLDLSKFALRRAARAHDRAAALAVDVWKPLPLRTGSAACVLSIFGPRNVPEIRRMLAPGGRFIVVTPTSRHLHQLVEALGLIRVDSRKAERLALQTASLRKVGRRELEYDVLMPRRDVLADASMGPSARHIDEAVLAGRVAALPNPQTVTVSVDITIYMDTAGLADAERRDG